MGTHVYAVTLHLYVRIVFERTRLQGRHATGRTIATVTEITGSTITEVTALELTASTVACRFSDGVIQQQRLVTLHQLGQGGSQLQRIGRIFFDQLVHQVHVDLKLFAHHGFPDALLELGHAVLVDVLGARHLHRLDGLTSGVLDGAQHAALAGSHEQDGLALATGTAGTADTVNVGFGIVRNVVVHHVGDALDVQTTGDYVGGDQDVQLALTQLVDGTLTQLLRDVTVQGFTGVTTGGQLAGQLFGGILGAHEDQYGFVRLDFQQTGHGVQLVQTGYLPVALADGRCSGRLGDDLDLFRLLQVLLGNTTDLVRHGGREQGNLTGGRALFHDPVHVVDEAHTQHFIGFVQYQGFQAGEVQVLATDQIHHTTRGTDDHLGTTAQGAGLGFVRGTTVDGQDMEVRHVLGVTLARLGNLQRQLTGRCQHQNLSVTVTSFQTRQQRQGKSSGLPCTGLRLPQQIVSRHQVGNCCGLDR